MYKLPNCYNKIKIKKKFALSVSNYICEAQYSLHSTCLKTQKNILSWLTFKAQETICIVNYRQLQYDELLENNTNLKYIRNMVQVTLKNIIY